MLFEILDNQIRTQIKDGLAHSYCLKTNTFLKPYPEVTGYIIHLFAKRGINTSLVEEMALKVCEYQNLSGAFRTFYDQRGYLFDTGVILRGLIAADQLGIPALNSSIDAAYQYILRSEKSGFWYSDLRSIKDYYLSLRRNSNWSWGYTPINLKLTEAMVDYDSMKYNTQTPDKFYRSLYQKLNNRTLLHSHPAGYQFEGLIALGKIEEATQKFKQHFYDKFKNGYIDYAVNSPYEYTSGTIQLGIIAYQLGYFELAKSVYDRFVFILNKFDALPQYLDSAGNLSGPHSEVNVWGAKYLIELEEFVLS